MYFEVVTSIVIASLVFLFWWEPIKHFFSQEPVQLTRFPLLRPSIAANIYLLDSQVDIKSGYHIRLRSTLRVQQRNRVDWLKCRLKLTWRGMSSDLIVNVAQLNRVQSAWTVTPSGSATNVEACVEWGTSRAVDLELPIYQLTGKNKEPFDLTAEIAFKRKTWAFAFGKEASVSIAQTDEFAWDTSVAFDAQIRYQLPNPTGTSPLITIPSPPSIEFQCNADMEEEFETTGQQLPVVELVNRAYTLGKAHVQVPVAKLPLENAQRHAITVYAVTVGLSFLGSAAILAACFSS